MPGRLDAPLERQKVRRHCHKRRASRRVCPCGQACSSGTHGGQHQSLVVEAERLVGQLGGLQRIVDARLVQAGQRLVQALRHGTARMMPPVTRLMDQPGSPHRALPMQQQSCGRTSGATVLRKGKHHSGTHGEGLRNQGREAHHQLAAQGGDAGAGGGAAVHLADHAQVVHVEQVGDGHVVVGGHLNVELTTSVWCHG